MRRRVRGLLAGVLAVAGLGVLGGCGSASDAGSTQAEASGPTGTSDNVVPTRAPRRYCKHPAGYKLLPEKPGRIVPHLGSEYPPDPMAHVVNGWSVGTGRADIHVQAGAADEQGTNGALAVSRFVACTPSNEPKHGEAVEVVELPGSGPVHITDAPMGASAARKPSDSVQVAFASTSGTKGILHLRDDSVSFSPSSTSKDIATPQKCAEVPPHALTVTATAIDCASAEAFVANSYGPCYPGDCHFQGFTCKEVGAVGGGLISMRCQDGARRIEWTWHS